MATFEPILPSHDQQPDRQGRRRPFSTWVKKLTNFKASSSGGREGGRHSSPSKLNHAIRMHAKRRANKKNNPYPQSGSVGNNHAFPPQNLDSVYSTSTRSGSETSLGHRSSAESRAPPTSGARSVALTVSTDHETSRSIAARSHGASSVTGTARTVGAQDSRRGGDSTFSSPAPSVRSLTTTLTTIQSVANGGNASAHNNHNSHHSGHHSHSHYSSVNNSHTITFNQPFPTSSPASALPPHLAPSLNQPTTYTTATANNLLTDNASILTLASSSKRRRRRSFDTDASVRALAPSSLWGGSRESLPLSVLSANIDAASSSAMPPTTPGLHQQQSGAPRGVVAEQRASMYSAVGVGGPALQSERNSIYARQSLAGDGASVRSGLVGHGRAESTSGSVGGLGISPLASPMEVSEKGDADELDSSAVAGKGKNPEGKP